VIGSVALTTNLQKQLRSHLLQNSEQEDLCFALWYPSEGKLRLSALLCEMIIPQEGERLLHGNASVTPDYFERALGEAMANGAGLAFMHSHPVPGWQGMSRDDIHTEEAMAAQAKSATGLPLLGMTIGSDGAWSARFWQRVGPGQYEKSWCQSVRVVGEEGLDVTFNDQILPPPKFREELKRTISVWGISNQQKIARLKVGVVGVGSVGSMVAETLARIGIQEISLIDFDVVEKHNLDRLLHAQKRDYLERNLKVEVVAAALKRSATAKRFTVNAIPYGVTELEGSRAALDCDVLFSCVDRPWGRYVLNLIAFAHLIPVVDGGIAVHTKENGSLQGADWQAHTAMPSRRCLECLGQYNSGFIELERRGFLDDPAYIQTLPREDGLQRNENVFPFSSNLASLQVLQMLSLVVRPLGISDAGTQQFHFVTGTMDTDPAGTCYDYCPFPSLIAKGDASGIQATGEHPKAREIRQSTRKPVSSLKSTLKTFFRWKTKADEDRTKL
jgi:molybdopterin-synthase adenylyltransferase